jgi:pimeloyl-ACP methyl ester carboxylesterase
MVSLGKVALAAALVTASALLSCLTSIKASSAEFRLLEFTPWLVKNKGPSEAKGVIYFILGWTNRATLGSYHLTPYFMKSLSESGWDIIAAKIPPELTTNPRATGLYHDVAPSMIRGRLRELKSDGYRRIVLGGHSWGGWITLLTGQGNSTTVDALLMSAPSVGPRVREGRGPNPFFQKNFSEFPGLAKGINTPLILMLYSQDEEDPGGRAEIVTKALEQKNVPHVVIDRPAGFTGHFAGWLPLFDYIYGRCISAFLDSQKSETCQRPGLVNDDFRSIISLKQIEDLDKKRITSADALVGKKFIAYTLGSSFLEWHYVNAGQRRGMTVGGQPNQQSFVFRESMHCAQGVCRVLIKWSDREVLEFDPPTGNLTAWWIEN